MKYLSAALTVLLFACNTQKQLTPAAPYVMAQDAGYPQINCHNRLPPRQGLYIPVRYCL
jgi:hypothetical protein